MGKYVLYVEGKQAYTVTHEDKDLAIQEAIRLSEKENRDVMILQQVFKIEQEKTYTLKEL
jgi:hypothetical protein